jgi:hypothetical protein
MSNEIIAILQKPIEALFDKSIGILKKSTYISLIIFLFILLNSIFQFSQNYVSSNQIENIWSIEEIKKTYYSGYMMSYDTLQKLNSLEDNIFYNQNYLERTYGYLTKITNGTIRVDYLMLLSIHWFWLFVLWSSLFDAFKKPNNSILESILVSVFIITIMFWWNGIFSVLIWLFNITDRNYQLLFNFTLNIAVIFSIYFFTKTKK